MYKAATRALVRRGIAQLNDGHPDLLLRLARPDVELSFPGDNSWATMHRPVRKGRHRHVTHRGIAECRAFAQRFAAVGLHYEIEDVLVNGAPWNTRVAILAHDYLEGPDGVDAYNNRVVSILWLRWGRVVRWETHEDTQRTEEFDRRRGLAGTSSP